MSFLATLLLAALPASPSQTGLQADYVEARTASVYAGACHAAGEYLTQGREAVLAWRFTAGEYDGVDLTGAEVVAVLSADRNLADPEARTQSFLVVDAAASEPVRAAALAALREACGERLGRIVAVRVEPVDVLRAGETFDVRAGKSVRLAGSTLPDRQCCKMPFDRWYEPFVAPVAETPSLVGNCDVFQCTDDTLGPVWARRGENNALLARVELLGAAR